MRLSCYLAIGLLLGFGGWTFAAEKPNVVFILADDLGYGDVGVYNPASKIPTPSLDRLAKEGLRFTDAHSPSAVCTPTRYGLLTGRYAWRTRLQRNVIGPYSQPLIDEKQLTVAGLLRGQGYATACVGKWHLGWGWPQPGEGGQRDFSRAIPNGPTTRGFDLYFGTDVPNYPPYCFFENDRTVGIPSVDAPVGRDAFNIAGKMVPDWKLVEVLPALEKRAVEFIEKAAKGSKPFFLYLPLTSPHYPVVPGADFKGKSKVGEYGDFVMQTDQTVGQVLDALKRAGVADKTLVIFTSDNGPEVSGEVKPGVYDRLKDFGHASMGALRGAKRDVWEGGHRVPFLARWPGKIAPGTTSDETICHVDLLATLATLLEVKLPADAGVDSVNILPALLGEKRASPLREATVHHSAQGKFAIRKGDWVLILALTGDDNRMQGEPAWFKKERSYEPHTEAGELFNLATDPSQKNNRYATEPAKVRELATLLERYVKDGRSTPGLAQKNDVEIVWDKRTQPKEGQVRLPVVDTHVHLWDIDRKDGLGWIAADNKVLNRSFLPDTHRPLATANGVRAIVVVQAGQSLADNQWNLDITAKDADFYRSVVGNLSRVIGTDDFAPLFEKLCKDGRYVGYRLSGRHQKTLEEAFFRDLRLTVKMGRTVDFLLGEWTFDDVQVICHRVPDLKIMLDHFGNVELNDQPLDAEWVRKFTAVAKHPNVTCKVSALFGRVKKQPAPTALAFYRPILDLAIEAFGEDRLVFGSDWPVSELTAEYASVLELVKTYFADKGQAIAEKVFVKNAVKFYGIADDPPSSDELKAKAAKGDVRAQMDLAYRYRDGKGVKRDYAEAMRWAHLAADRGDAGAQDFVGWMYFQGLGVKHSPEIAAGYFRAAAAGKSAAGAWNLGQCYFAAQGVDQDVPRALETWKKAAALGHGGAAFTAAMVYLAGEGIAADQKEARRLAERAAELNDPSGLVVLGEMQFQAGEIDKARATWTKVTAMKPGDSEAAQQGSDLLKLIDHRSRKAEPGQFALVAMPHIHQGWNNCGATSCAMFARAQGKQVGGWDVKRLCPSPLGTGTDWGDLLKAAEKLDLRWKLVTFTPDDAGFDRATAFAKAELDAGRPLVIDFKFTGPQYPNGEAGHTLALVGYIAKEDLYILSNPAIASPGLQLMTAKDLKHLWRSDHYGKLSKNVLSRPAIVLDR